MSTLKHTRMVLVKVNAGESSIAHTIEDYEEATEGETFDFIRVSITGEQSRILSQRQNWVPSSLYSGATKLMRGEVGRIDTARFVIDDDGDRATAVMNMVEAMLVVPDMLIQQNASAIRPHASMHLDIHGIDPEKLTAMLKALS